VCGAVETRAAEEIAAAARRTLAAGSARVHVRAFNHPPRPVARDLGFVQEGMTDLVRRRTRVEHRFSGRGWDASVERFVEHFPWFDEDGGSASMTMLYAGTESFFRVDCGGGWRSPCDGDVAAPRRHTADPVWIVEVLCQVDGAEQRAAGEACGESCRRFGFGIDLRGHRERVEVPPRGVLRGPHLAGDVWIDAAGRIRRVTRTSFAARRPRLPWRGAGAWYTTERSDFGVDADIELPAVVDRDRTAWPAVLSREVLAKARTLGVPPSSK
jgi:hypothetical protein